MFNIDRHIAISAGWVAGPAFGVAMMAAPEYFHLAPLASGLLFWGGILVFGATIAVVVIVSLHQEHRRKTVLGPVITMAVGALIFGFGAAWYFWPVSQAISIAPTSANIIGSPQNRFVDFIIAVEITSERDDLTLHDWTLSVQSANEIQRISAIPVLEPMTWGLATGGELTLTPDTSLLGKTDKPLQRGVTRGRILFRTDRIAYVDASQLSNKITLIAKNGDMQLASPQIALSDLGPVIGQQPAIPQNPTPAAIQPNTPPVAIRIGKAEGGSVEGTLTVGMGLADIGESKDFTFKNNVTLNQLPPPVAMASPEFFQMSNEDLKKQVMDFAATLDALGAKNEAAKAILFDKGVTKSNERQISDLYAAQDRDFQNNYLPKTRALQGEIMLRLVKSGQTQIYIPPGLNPIHKGFRNLQAGGLFGAYPASSIAEYLRYAVSELPN